MTDTDYKTIQALAKCRFAPGSWDKRFVHDLASFPPEKELSERQRAALTSVAWSYRKQLGRHGIAVVTKPQRLLDEEAAAAQRERDRLQAWNEGRPL